MEPFFSITTIYLDSSFVFTLHYVPIHDSLGNIMTLLDLSGETVASYRYTAFGEEETQGLPLNPWRFAGKRTDPETGFLHFDRRYYLPEIGRWLTPNPLWFADGPNIYTYVHNHPLAYTRLTVNI